MSFWYLYLDPHLTTYHSNVSVLIIVVLELGMSNLQSHILNFSIKLSIYGLNKDKEHWIGLIHIQHL